MSDPSTNRVISVDGVHKRYGSLQVLQGLSLGVSAGEVYGFLGRNGAGKSTTIRLLMGISRPDQGQIELFGASQGARLISARQRIGYVAQEQHFYPWMSPKDLGRFISGLYPRWSDGQYASLLQRFQLPATRRVADFSGGMKARLALSLALATQPELLLLDEPTAGMDPVGRREFLDLVRTHARQEGAAIFFSTHVMDDIEALASRIGVIEKGRTLYEGDLDVLVDSLATYSVATDAPDAGDVPELHGSAPFRVVDTRTLGDRRHVVLKFDEPATSPVMPRLPWRSESMSLEDVFVSIVSADT